MTNLVGDFDTVKNSDTPSKALEETQISGTRSTTNPVSDFNTVKIPDTPISGGKGSGENGDFRHVTVHLGSKKPSFSPPGHDSVASENPFEIR